MLAPPLMPPKAPPDPPHHHNTNARPIQPIPSHPCARNIPPSVHEAACAQFPPALHAQRHPPSRAPPHILHPKAYEYLDEPQTTPKLIQPAPAARFATDRPPEFA